MAPTTADECLSFLGEAKQALEEIQDLNERETECRQEEQQSDRAYEAEKKKMTDEVARTLRSRREEIEKSYNDEIAKDQDKLKKARNKREKAKNEGIKDRIADETADLEKDIDSYRTQIKKLGQTEHLPAYCRSGLYMSLYYPRHPKDILTLFIGILIFFALIPLAVYFLIPERRPAYLIAIYVVLLVVVAGLYIAIGVHTRKEHADAIKTCRGLYDQIYEKKKSIDSTTRAIRKDTSEGSYDLARYDDDISRIQQDLDDVTGRKQEALDNYENVTKNILTDEIEGNYKDRLAELEQAKQDAADALSKVSDELKTKRLNVSDDYSPLLGKDFSDPVKIDSLIQIVKEQGCQNISEAIACYKANEKQFRADERARSRKGAKADTAPAKDSAQENDAEDEDAENETASGMEDTEKEDE